MSDNQMSRSIGVTSDLKTLAVEGRVAPSRYQLKSPWRTNTDQFILFISNRNTYNGLDVIAFLDPTSIMFQIVLFNM